MFLDFCGRFGRFVFVICVYIFAGVFVDCEGDFGWAVVYDYHPVFLAQLEERVAGSHVVAGSTSTDSELSEAVSLLLHLCEAMFLPFCLCALTAHVRL
jgi:hypothetical protein